MMGRTQMAGEQQEGQILNSLTFRPSWEPVLRYQWPFLCSSKQVDKTELVMKFCHSESHLKAGLSLRTANNEQNRGIIFQCTTSTFRHFCPVRMYSHNTTI